MTTLELSQIVDCRCPYSVGRCQLKTQTTVYQKHTQLKTHETLMTGFLTHRWMIKLRNDRA